MLTLLDCHNFWSPTGGGVRRYQLEKLRHLGSRDDVRYVFVQPDSRTFTERAGPRATVEHVRGLGFPGDEGYRQIVSAGPLRRLLRRHQPDLVECGSPYFMPPALLRAVGPRLAGPALVGFWHADFPRAHFARLAGRVHARLAGPAEKLGWAWARRGYGRFDAVMVGSPGVGAELVRRGLARVYHVPLGVDLQAFDPDRRDPALVERWRAGAPERVVILFAHRLCEEKGLSCLLSAYEELCVRMRTPPALVLAGSGPGREKVARAASRHPHVHSLGYVDSPAELGRIAASCDLAVCLSAWETFGLSTAEAMASGLPVLAADGGAAAELAAASCGGCTVRHDDPRALAATIEAMIASGDLRARGAAARAHVRRFTWTATFERLLACYREIVESRRAGGLPRPGLHVPG